MATKFPLQINNLRFKVNPTGLNITKPVSYAPLSTQNGVIYQVWFDAPEILSISGISAGNTAFEELNFLKRNFERTDKISELFYKTRIYKGFITNMTVDANITGHPNTFTYSITFQLLFGEQFAIQDFAVTGKETGPIGRRLRKLSGSLNKRLDKFSQKRFF